MSTQISSDLALRVLRLEQRLESYQRLHSEELDNIRGALDELKALVLALEAREVNHNQAEDAKSDRE